MLPSYWLVNPSLRLLMHIWIKLFSAGCTISRWHGILQNLALQLHHETFKLAFFSGSILKKVIREGAVQRASTSPPMKPLIISAAMRPVAGDASLAPRLVQHSSTGSRDCRGEEEKKIVFFFFLLPWPSGRMAPSL